MYKYDPNPFDPESAEYSSGVGVYTGNNIGALTLVAAHANDFDVNEVTFNVTAGTAYQISVDGFHFAVGTASGKYKLSGSMQGLENFRVKTAGQAQGNGTGLSAEGLPGMEFVLQVSTNLVNWINVSTQALATSSMELDVTNLMSLPQSFYRLRTTR